MILALMVLPTVMLLSRLSLAAVPRRYIVGAHALGLGRLTIVKNIGIRHAFPGIMTGIVLATARAIGETMAVVMVCGNIVRVPKSVFEPVRALTANIAMEMGDATGNHRSALFLSGLLLLGMVFILFAINSMIASRFGRITGKTVKVQRGG